MKPYYQDEYVALYNADFREVQWLRPWATVVIDPPWDEMALLDDLDVGGAAKLVFTDGRRMGDAVTRYGAPAWLFTWDTMNTWQTGARRPVQQTKHCLWYGKLENYQRDAVLWGDAPPARNHPTTKQTPLDGRRMTDLWRESLRWLHNPTAGNGSTGTERFGKRDRNPLSHAKPTGWLRCLLGNCTTGMIFDPFSGSGASLVAAKSLGREAVGCDTDEACCEAAAERLSQNVLDFGGAA